jgi:uncharacterized protein involved in exopolysaccharide biosynthesis
MSTTVIPDFQSPWRDLGGHLARNRRGMIIAFLSTTILFGGVALLLPPSYKSESVLMVRLGPEYLVNADPANTDSFPERREVAASEIAILTAPELILRVLDEIGLKRVYPSLAATIDPTDPQSVHDARESALIKFGRHLAALPGKDSTLLNVSYTNTDPEVAGTVLQQLVRDYLEMRRRHFQYASGPALEAEFKATADRLEAASHRLDALRQRGGISDFDLQMANLFTEKTDVSRIRDQAQGEVPALQAQVASLQASLDQIGESVPLQTVAWDGEALKAVKEAIAQLRLKANELHVAFKDDVPQLVDIQRQIGMAQSLLRTYGQDKNMTVTTGRANAYDLIQRSLKEAMGQLAATQARLAAASARLNEIDQAIAGLDDNRALLQQLLREQKVAEDAYFQAGRRLNEAIAHDQMMEANKPNVEVVQAARVPYQETWVRVIVAAGGLVLGAIIAAGLAYVDSLGRSREMATG